MTIRIYRRQPGDKPNPMMAAVCMWMVFWASLGIQIMACHFVYILQGIVK